ncbi:ABC transporter ATP-binding protein [Patulibacter defluvii]|uniref:ABC transporter ATP-binding protein n=1 Tax=Patulibacter defluvii TaxID=3095358 RepID=UPI002A75C676|nr:ABC transporter ATP-binding protein [Patulibacter sp. DM4]
MSLLRIERLTKTFRSAGGHSVFAVNGVDLEITEGETVGLIGESGSGKSTVGRLAIRLLDPDEGVVSFDGSDLASLDPARLRKARAGFQAVFQEPFESLNPRLTIGAIIAEPLVNFAPQLSRAERRAKVLEALESVRLPAEFLDRRPGDLSGGQQQRVGIARAIVAQPRFVVLDEPTSSLDLTVRAAMLELLAELQERLGLAYLFISHDIQTVRYFCRRTAVMYLGRVVEIGPTAEVIERPKHPYTRALLSAALSTDPDDELPHYPLQGDIPSPTALPPGCPLVGRCPLAIDACSSAPPPLTAVGHDHQAACIRVGAETAAPTTAIGGRG